MAAPASPNPSPAKNATAWPSGGEPRGIGPDALT